MAPAKANLTVLISGSGSNLQALIDATTTSPAPLPNATITRVISDRKDAYGLQRARAASIPTLHHGILPYKQRFPDASGAPPYQQARAAYDAELARLVLADAPRLVVCAGFMRIVSPAFLAPLGEARVPMVNLHPALHGDLVGAGCIERAWEEFRAGRRSSTGVMVHYVIAEVDMGEPICQREVPMEGCGSLEELQERIHAVEHELIVEGVGKVVTEVLARGEEGGE